MPYETDITLTSKGQFTLPAELRKRWNMKAGDKLHVVLRDDGTAVVAPRQPKRFLDWAQSIKPVKLDKPLTDAEIDEAIGRAIAEDYAESERRSGGRKK
jgi:AbrB family looped-hinge helix DNA binding protein